MTRLAIIAALLASPAVAQDTADLSGTTLKLQASQRAGAVAEIVMNNRLANSPLDEVGVTLAMGAIVVTGKYDWDRNGKNADALIVTPPDGLMCLPVDCVLVVDEGHGGTLWLFDLDGVGM